MARSSTTLGPWVRLEGISISQLPPGGRGVKPTTAVSSTEKFTDGSGATAAPSLKQFMKNILSESIPFIDGVAPKTGGSSLWKVKGPPKKYASSEAPVHLYERVVSGSELDKLEGMSQFSADRNDETWYCRRSCHRDEAQTGTASWEEFTRSFKQHHAETEMAFTPTVIGAREAMKWDTSGIEVDINGERWSDITMVVEEMKHKIDPKPLRNRTFPVVQLTAALAGTREFLVASTPLNNFKKSPFAEYARDKSLVVAAYTSVERVRILPNTGEVEWIMATASNAGGVIPQWMQNLVVPSAVAKDVHMFLSWIPSQRNSAVKANPISRLESGEKALPAAPTSINNATPPPISKTETRPSRERADSADKGLPAVPVQ